MAVHLSSRQGTLYRSTEHTAGVTGAAIDDFPALFAGIFITRLRAVLGLNTGVQRNADIHQSQLDSARPSMPILRLCWPYNMQERSHCDHRYKIKLRHWDTDKAGNYGTWGGGRKKTKPQPYRSLLRSETWCTNLVSVAWHIPISSTHRHCHLPSIVGAVG